VLSSFILSIVFVITTLVVKIFSAVYFVPEGWNEGRISLTAVSYVLTVARFIIILSFSLVQYTNLRIGKLFVHVTNE